MITDISKVNSIEELPSPYNSGETTEEMHEIKGNVLTTMERAVQITERIKANGRIAVNAVCSIGKDLRTMKIDELYTELGYESFEDYAEKEFQLKRRQAYQYISVYEKLGEEFVQSNAQLGITKLSLLVAANPEDRTEIMESEDVQGMTSKELEEALAKCKQQGEQLSMLEEENIKLKEESELDRKEQENANAAAQRYKNECKHRAEDQQRLEGRVKNLEEELKDKERIIANLEGSVKEKEVIKEVPDKKTEKELAKVKKAQAAAEKELEKAKSEIENVNRVKEQMHEEAQKKISELNSKIEELSKAAEKPAENADKSNFKAILTSVYKEIIGLVEFIKSSDNPEERKVFFKKALEVLNAGKDSLKGIELPVVVEDKKDV